MERRCSSGRAGSRSTARSASARSPAGGGAGGSRSPSQRSPTPSPPASRSARPSAGSATGSTRSCTASRPTLPWGLEIDPAHRAPGFEQYATFHPTFLYESIWNLLVAGILLWADRRFRLGRGKVFALYIALYGFGRIFTEHIRLDYSYDTFGPIRFNEAVAMLICLVGVALFVALAKFRPGREDVVEFGTTRPRPPDGSRRRHAARTDAEAEPAVVKAAPEDPGPDKVGGRLSSRPTSGRSDQPLERSRLGSRVQHAGGTSGAASWFQVGSRL